MNRTDTVHKQLQRLMQGGLTPDEACSALRNLGFTQREVDTFTTTGVFRGTESPIVHGGRVIQHIGRAAGPPRRSTASVEARSNSLLADPDPLFRGWDKPLRSRRWDKVISAGSLLAIECGAAALMVMGTAHVASSFQSKTGEIWTAISGTVVTAVALMRMRRVR